LRDKISPHAQRWLSVVVWGVVSVLYGTLSLATFKMLSIVHDEKSAILGVPQSVTFGCVMLGMVCLMVLAIKDTIVAWKTPAATLAATYAATGPNTNY
jgi:TRAP-type C4-dicarboxylate transport system permease small subunit